MQYESDGRYKIQLNGQEVVVSAEELREAFVEIKNFEKQPINDYIEECPANYIYEDSARYELLRTEIQDSAFENIVWDEDIRDVLDIAVESAMTTAHNWYTAKYHMESKI